LHLATAGSISPDTSWSDLITQDDDSRQRSMIERFTRLSTVEAAARLDELEGMARAEYALPDADLHRFTASRLRAWIELDRIDPGQAQLLASAYDAVFQRVPVELAMRRAMLVQSVERSALTVEEVAELRRITKGLMQDEPASMPSAMGGLRERVVTGTSKQRPAWQFWR
jgi:hypothetical protein